MIKSYVDLKKVIKIEKELHLGNDSIRCFLNASEGVYIYRFLRALRKCEYHMNAKGIGHKILYYYYLRKKNIYGAKYGLYAWPNSIGTGIYISHLGSILINGNAKIGKNCILHGENCVGSIGHGTIAPVLGDNVELGVGAKVIGDVYLADGIIVGANAVVTNSCYERNAVLVGVPAHKINRDC